MGTNRNRYLGTNRQTERATVNTIKQLHIEKNGAYCAYCGKHLTSQTMTLDHIIPVALGGRTTLRNTALSCFACNKKKGSKQFHEWIPHITNPQPPEHIKTRIQHAANNAIPKNWNDIKDWAKNNPKIIVGTTFIIINTTDGVKVYIYEKGDVMVSKTVSEKQSVGFMLCRNINLSQIKNLLKALL